MYPKNAVLWIMTYDMSLVFLPFFIRLIPDDYNYTYVFKSYSGSCQSRDTLVWEHSTRVVLYNESMILEILIGDT
jgi:hypothetical protein